MHTYPTRHDGLLDLYRRYRKSELGNNWWSHRNCFKRQELFASLILSLIFSSVWYWIALQGGIVGLIIIINVVNFGFLDSTGKKLLIIVRVSPGDSEVDEEEPDEYELDEVDEPDEVDDSDEADEPDDDDE